MLRRWGNFAATHHWWVIGTWIVVVPALWVLGLAVGGEPDNSFSLPGSPSQDAQDLLESDFPAAAGASATVVYHSTTGATSPPTPPSRRRSRPACRTSPVSTASPR